MKKTPFIVLIILSFMIEVVFFTLYLSHVSKMEQDTVAINEVVKSIEINFGDESAYSNSLKYVVIDNNGNVLYKNAEGLSENVNDAIRNSDAVIGISSGDAKVIIHNEISTKVENFKKKMVLFAIFISGMQLILVLLYFLHIKRTVTDPFVKMDSFAKRVAGGDLDIPLEMDRKNAFGSFTEAFDIMRSELKKSREAEKKAIDDKKEMIAKLSHDIKTPIASIKSTSEIGYELTREERTKELFNQINIKSDQLTNLADNLFHSSINDITEIAVSPSNYESEVAAKLIRNADYLGKIKDFEVPGCMIYMDKLRLQQALDNVITNSYKYAGTDIDISCRMDEEYLIIAIKDHGPGVSEGELPLLKEKYKRGSNTAEKEGAGLGLYLTDYFLEKMNGKLKIKNADPGFCAELYLRIV